MPRASSTDAARKTTAPTMGVGEATGEDFIVALADRNAERLGACFHSEIRLRAIVPRGYQEYSGPSAVAARFNTWFAEAESIQILEKNVYRVGDRLHIRYRFRERYADGDSETIEQDAYCDMFEGHIVAMDLLCSGHRPEEREGTKDVHIFDAGDMGCSSGLPEEFRRQIGAVPMGSMLEILTRDPAAKEDLPSLARLLGHRLVAVKDTPDGRTALVVQRGS
ncbi:MAG TPA: sulfurtransferase TusA family protein [Conexivisphaerales archaeon]|nr:sulfurtransferase TusA family protein [Conexivisphaerales archaeon]